MRCPVCGRMFTQHTSMLRHLAALHQLDENKKPLSEEEIARQRRRYEKHSAPKVSAIHLPTSDTPATAAAGPSGSATLMDALPVVAGIVQDAPPANPPRTSTPANVPLDIPPPAKPIDAADQIVDLAGDSRDTTDTDPGDKITNLDVSFTAPQQFEPLNWQGGFEDISPASMSPTRTNRQARSELFGLDASALNTPSVRSAASSPERRSTVPSASGAKGSSSSSSTASPADAAANQSVPPPPLNPTVIILPPPTSTAIDVTVSAPPSLPSVVTLADLTVALAAVQPSDIVVPAAPCLVALPDVPANTSVAVAPTRKRKRPTGKPLRMPSGVRHVATSPPPMAGNSAAVAGPARGLSPPRQTTLTLRHPLTFAALYQQVRLHPHDDATTLANTLAVRYQWTAEEREVHRRRLYDIRATLMYSRLDEVGELPVVRTPATMDVYLAGLHDRVAEARQYRNTTEDE